MHWLQARGSFQPTQSAVLHEEVRYRLSDTLCSLPCPQVFGVYCLCPDLLQTPPFGSTPAVTVESCHMFDEMSGVVKWKEFWSLSGALWESPLPHPGLAQRLPAVHQPLLYFSALAWGRYWNPQAACLSPSLELEVLEHRDFSCRAHSGTCCVGAALSMATELRRNHPVLCLHWLGCSLLVWA